MRKVIVFLTLLLAISVSVYGTDAQTGKTDKMDLDILITNDQNNSMFYFNGTGTAEVEYNGQKYTARIDIDFEHPENGRYGTLTVFDMNGKAVDKYIFTDIKIHGDALSKGATLKGVDGTKASLPVNIGFRRDSDRNYTLFFFHETLPYFESGWQVFESELRIAPREKSEEELAKEARLLEEKQRQEALAQAERERKEFKKEVYDTTQAIVVMTSVIFALVMLPKAFRRRKVSALIGFTVMALLSCFPPFFILPLLPGYFWWYASLYSTKRHNDDLMDIFRTITYISTAVLGILFYCLVGNITLLYIVVWVIAGYFAYITYEDHTKNSRCHHCRYYGPNHVADRELIKQKIVRTTTTSREFSHSEEREDEIINWYRKRYNVKVEAHQTFKDFRQCEHCGEIFITYRFTIKTLSNKTY